MRVWVNKHGTWGVVAWTAEGSVVWLLWTWGCRLRMSKQEPRSPLSGQPKNVSWKAKLCPRNRTFVVDCQLSADTKVMICVWQFSHPSVWRRGYSPVYDRILFLREWIWEYKRNFPNLLGPLDNTYSRKTSQWFKNPGTPWGWAGRMLERGSSSLSPLPKWVMEPIWKTTHQRKSLQSFFLFITLHTFAHKKLFGESTRHIDVFMGAQHMSPWLHKQSDWRVFRCKPVWIQAQASGLTWRWPRSSPWASPRRRTSWMPCWPSQLCPCSGQFTCCPGHFTFDLKSLFIPRERSKQDLCYLVS